MSTAKTEKSEAFKIESLRDWHGSHAWERITSWRKKKL